METVYSSEDYTNVSSKNDIRVAQLASGEYAIHQFKDYAGDYASATLEWEGKSDYAPSSSIVKLEVYNHDSNEWELVDSDNSTGEDTDFTLTGSIADLTNYKDTDKVISCRVWQQAI